MKRTLFALAAVALGIHHASAQPAVDTLSRIKATRVVNVAYSPDSLPFSLAGANGEPSGYTIDLCKRVIAQIGSAIGDPGLKVNWIAGSVGERLDMVVRAGATGMREHDADPIASGESRLLESDLRRRWRPFGQGCFADPFDERPRGEARRRAQGHDDRNATGGHAT